MDLEKLDRMMNEGTYRARVYPLTEQLFKELKRLRADVDILLKEREHAKKSENPVR